ncbi:hypothetical protein [Prescottella agglutinans]|uniref:hypothetical protein n=1 Tax=Prescottella agglutinans TaxID=1644129 RepID=UPI003D95D7CE
MSEPIPYDRMRRLLGLPDLRVGPPGRWAVRKIRTGERSGLWGVWPCPAAETANHLVVEAFRSWTDAIAWVRRAVDER